MNTEPLAIVRVDSFEATVAGGNELKVAYLKMTTQSGEALNILIDSKRTACKLAGLLLSVADNLP